MDAEKVVKEFGRMCSSMENCADCKVSQLRDEEPHFCMHYVYKYPAETVRIVEEWSKAHPILTNGQKLYEVFGELPEGTIRAQASWWLAPYKAPQGE